MTETDALVALHLTPELGPVRIRRLIGEFGSALQVVQTPPPILHASGALSPSGGCGLAQILRERVWEKEIDKLAALGAWVLPFTDPRYPRSLAQLANAPVLLEVLGTLEACDRHALAIVGSRDCTFYGTESAKRFAYQLAAARWTVVSGLARGIDTAAHLGALAAHGRTIAVLGSGLARVYPNENRGLAERIAAHGAVLSEFPVDYPPSAQTFPYRNRVVAGLSQGLLLVEAGLQSGALITANLAADFGRQVFAIPGPIDRPNSVGANRLIQDGAKLVMDAADVLDEMSVLIPSTNGPLREKNLEKESPPDNPIQAALLRLLAHGEMDPDTLVRQSGMSAPEVTSNLLALELNRKVTRTAGNWYRLGGSL